MKNWFTSLNGAITLAAIALGLRLRRGNEVALRTGDA